MAVHVYDLHVNHLLWIAYYSCRYNYVKVSNNSVIRIVGIVVETNRKYENYERIWMK